MEISSEGKPMFSPSSAPQEVTDTAEIINPPLIIRSAVFPITTVSAELVKIPIRLPGMERQRTVPTIITTNDIPRAVRYIL